MVAGSSFTNIFGGSALRPSQPSYLALSIAATTALVWPLETTESTPGVAAQMDVTATAGGLQLQFPPGNTGSNGAQSIVTNVGSNSFTVTDQAGNAIAVLATTQSWLITLIDNTTANGTWRGYQIASTVSTATASGLAGPGLQAAGSELQVAWTTTSLSANTTITASYRGNAIIWTGAVGALQFDTIANLTAGWYCAFANQGTDVVTLTGTGGQTINGQASLAVAPGNSGILICGTAGFNSFGAVLGPLSLSNGGTGANTASAALTNLGGTSLGKSLFTAPNAGAAIALLGLTGYTFTESTINSSLVLSESSSNTVYVCTAALTLTLPLSTTLPTSFVIAVFAQQGIVTLTPQATDSINGQTAAASFAVNQGASLLLVTDANGNYWPLFNASGANIGDLKATASAITPTGWLLCYGQAVSRTAYAALFASIGSTWGAGDGSTTFNVPDLRGRALFGADAMGGTAAGRLTTASLSSAAALGVVGGSQLLVAHSHGITDPGHSHSVNDPTHNHTASDSGHSHGASDSGHTHSITDNGHAHGVTAATNGLAPSNVQGGSAIGINNSAIPTSTVGTGIVINAGYANTSIATGNANVTVAAHATNISINPATTGISTVTAGGGTSQNVPPAAVVNWLIYAGA